MNKYSLFFYFLSFLEGASVMAAELLGAKMLAPYFGTSLYVWSSVLAITLSGLAIGYFAGGVISENKKKERYLYYALLASAVFLVIMPVLAKEVMIYTVGFGLLASILISSFVFLFPPIFFMGMVSPLAVECVISAARLNVDTGKEKIQNSGKTAGSVYAISTFGGILSTFFLGFYCIPHFGLTKPAIVMGLILGVIPFLKLIRMKKFLSLFFPLMAFFSLNSLRLPAVNSDVNILYASEGLLGQIIVADYPLYEGTNKIDGSQRMLFVNRSTQTVVRIKNDKKSFLKYVHLISERIQAQHLQALVFGLGGGCLADEFSRKGLEVDAVELDPRMAEVARKYFDLPGMVKVTVDDARHFLRNYQLGILKQKKYDVIVLDAFVGEVNPHHLFTREFFKEVSSVLSDEGMFFINGNGYWKDGAGKGMRSVCKTLVNSGFNVEVMQTEKEEDYRNLIFIAKKTAASIGGVSSAEILDLNLSDAIVLIDENPQLEILNMEANKRWREACMQYFLRGYYSKQDMLLFE